MIFSLEVLRAKKGDCLILHYGKKTDPRFIVIDGGPAGVYTDFLKPRLLDIKKALMPEDPLPLSMVMVSHFDDDHINGVLQMTNDVINAVQDHEKPKFQIKNLWFNAFDDIVGNEEVAAASGIAASAVSASTKSLSAEFAGIDEHVAAVISSTAQGRQLRNDAKFLSVPVNSPFKPLSKGKPNLVRFDTTPKSIKWDKTLKFYMVHPNKQRLMELQKQWDKDLKTAKSQGDNSIIVAAMSAPDTSPFNLSSIVCLVELQKKRILLTGDARGDDIVEGLQQRKLLDAKGRIHVDVLKIPHHGSDRNVTPDFFEKITADHYVFSGDGSHHNPESATLEMLAMATRERDNFTIHFTYHDGKYSLKKKLDDFVEKQQQMGRTFKVNFMPENDNSILLDLLEAVDY